MNFEKCFIASLPIGLKPKLIYLSISQLFSSRIIIPSYVILQFTELKKVILKFRIVIKDVPLFLKHLKKLLYNFLLTKYY